MPKRYKNVSIPVELYKKLEKLVESKQAGYVSVSDAVKDALRELLRKLSSETGLTVLVSSHILGEMQLMCDRVGIINKGKMITIKTVEELINMNQDGDNIQLTLKTDNNEKAVSVLSTMNIKNSITAEGVEIEIDKNGVPELVKTLTGENIAIFSMNKKEMQSLEDVFMKLTGEVK